MVISGETLKKEKKMQSCCNLKLGTIYALFKLDYNSQKRDDENHIHNILSKTPLAILLAHKQPAGVFLL